MPNKVAKYVRIWNEAVVASYYCPSFVWRECGKSPDRDSNRVRSEYQSEALPLLQFAGGLRKENTAKIFSKMYVYNMSVISRCFM
jgi:hypothetical protein